MKNRHMKLGGNHVLQNEERGEQKGHEKVGNGMAVKVPHPNPCYPEGYEVGKKAHEDAAPPILTPIWDPWEGAPFGRSTLVLSS